MRHAPNIITISRIIFSAVLFFVKPFSVYFWVLYSLCGLSDMADGFIARKTNTASSLGAMLDSISDMVFIGAAAVIILPVISIPGAILIWIALIALIRITGLLIASSKYHTFAVLHTYSNKATGILLFTFPYLYKLLDIYAAGFIICTFATLAAVEELIIHMTSEELSRNVKSILKKGR